MVIDTSALIAILLGEPESEALIVALASAGPRLLSSINALETAIVVEARKGPSGARELDLLIHAAGLEIVPFSGEQMEIARDAWRHFGKGRHVAGLNLGDCCAYALSRSSGEPLLFKGDDFNHTDAALMP